MNFANGYQVVPLQDSEKSLPFVFNASPDVTFASISYGSDHSFVKLDDNSQYEVVPLAGSQRLGSWINF